MLIPWGANWSRSFCQIWRQEEEIVEFKAFFWGISARQKFLLWWRVLRIPSPKIRISAWCWRPDPFRRSFSKVSQNGSPNRQVSLPKVVKSHSFWDTQQLAELDRLSNLDSSVSSHRTWFIWVSLKRIKNAYPMVYEGLSTFIMIFSVKIVTTPFLGSQIPKYAI